MSGEFDMSALFEKAQAVQQQLLEAQAAAAEQVVEGQAGGGAVKVRITGGLKVETVTVDPGVIGAADVGMLEDLVVAAVNDALARAQELNQSAIGNLGLGGPSGLLGL